MQREDLDTWFPTIQRYVLLFFGLAGVAYETIVDKVDRPYLLVLFGGMLGLSQVISSWNGKKEEPKLPFLPGKTGTRRSK